MSCRRYVHVSPCRDEADYMRRTLDSLMAQSVLPAFCVVVDDGFTDNTPSILGSYRARLPYLSIVRRGDRGGRSVGSGVIEAFYAGLLTVSLEDYDYLCMRDLDLDLPPRYFETPPRHQVHQPRPAAVRPATRRREQAPVQALHV